MTQVVGAVDGLPLSVGPSVGQPGQGQTVPDVLLALGRQLPVFGQELVLFLGHIERRHGAEAQEIIGGDAEDLAALMNSLFIQAPGAGFIVSHRLAAL